MAKKDLNDFINKLKAEHDKRVNGNTTLLQRKRQSMVPRSTLIGKYSTTQDRENEARINTDNEEDYRRFMGGVETKRMMREAKDKANRRNKK